MGDNDLPFTVARSDRHVALINIWHMFSSSSCSPCINPLRKYYMMCESLWRWGFRFGVFYSITTFFPEKFPCAGYP